MRVKDVDDFDENWQMDGPYEHAYVCKNWRLWASRFFAVHNHTFQDRQSDGRMEVVHARI